jgi:hypothetical protein
MNIPKKIVVKVDKYCVKDVKFRLAGSLVMITEHQLA